MLDKREKRGKHKKRGKLISDFNFFACHVRLIFFIILSSYNVEIYLPL